MEFPIVMPAQALERREVVPVGGELALSGRKALSKILHTHIHTHTCTERVRDLEIKHF